MRKHEAKNKVLVAALECAQDNVTEEFDAGDPNADAQREVNDEVLIKACREYTKITLRHKLLL